MPTSSAGCLGDHDHVGLRNALKPCREVRCLANDAPLPRRSCSDHVSDHDFTGRDAHADLQRPAGRRDQFAHRPDELETRPDGALGVMFVRQRITEIDEQTVTHVFRDVPAVALHDLRATTMIGGDQRAQIFDIELGGQGSRPDQIAEQQGELAAFGGPGILGVRNAPRVQLADRPQQFAAIAQDDPEVLQILIGKIGQNREIDAIFKEARGIFGQAEFFEPLRDLLHRMETSRKAVTARGL